MTPKNFLLYIRNFCQRTPHNNKRKEEMRFPVLPMYGNKIPQGIVLWWVYTGYMS